MNTPMQDMTNHLLCRMNKRTGNPESCAAIDDLVDVAAECLRLKGKSPAGSSVSALNAALTSTDFPEVLSNTVNKVAADKYPQVYATFESITDGGVMSNFLPASVVKVGASGVFEEIPANGEYKSIPGFAEGSETGALKSYGGQVPISRQAIINDDLNILIDSGGFLARSAKATQNIFTYQFILSNPNLSDGTPVFDASRGNLLSGAGSALDIDSLSTAMKTLRLMADAQDRPLGIEPKTLLLPPSLEGTGAALCKLINAQSKERLTVVVEPLLEATYLTGVSSTAWYLLPDPEACPVFRVLTLEGRGSTPNIASISKIDFDNIYFKGQIDFSVLAVSHRAVKSDGV